MGNRKKSKKIMYIPFKWKMSSYLIMGLFAILTITPILWLSYTSLKSNAEIQMAPLALPEGIELENYTRAWEIGNMGMSIFNSIFYSTIATAFSLLLSMAAAFGLTKFQYKSSAFIYGGFTIGLLITIHALILPLFLMETRLGIINTRIGLILPYIAISLPMSVIIACAYIRSLPNALIEAALIDGASYFRIFFSIVLPCSKPVIATLAILSFLNNWNEFILAFVLTTGNDKRTIPVSLTNFASRFNVDYGTQFAAIVISIIPMIIFYIIFHNALMKGFGEGGIKE